MNTLTQNQNRAADQPASASRDYVVPAVNISSNANEYLVEAEMPGVAKDGIEVLVEGNQLTILGRRQAEAQTGEFLYCESCPDDYRRVFEIASDIDTAKISAQMDQGVLKLRLPKVERVKPRKIPIGG